MGRKDACREDSEKLRLGEGCERSFEKVAPLTKESSSLAWRKIYVWGPKSNSWEGRDNARCWTVLSSALFFASIPLMEALLSWKNDLEH